MSLSLGGWRVTRQFLDGVRGRSAPGWSVSAPERSFGRCGLRLVRRRLASHDGAGSRKVVRIWRKTIWCNTLKKEEVMTSNLLADMFAWLL